MPSVNNIKLALLISCGVAFLFICLVLLAAPLGLGTFEEFLLFRHFGIDRTEAIYIGAGLFAASAVFLFAVYLTCSRRLRQNTAVLTASVAVCLFFLEAGLRLADGIPFWPLHNIPASRAALLTFQTQSVFHPRLGWTMRSGTSSNPHLPQQSFTTGAHGIRMNDAVVKPLAQGGMLAVGDSFTAGSEVGDTETWPAILERQMGEPVVNAGVGGWATDQIVLRAEELVGLLSPHTLIVSFLDQDILRAGFRVFGGGNKPWFSVREGKLQHHNDPVPVAAASPKIQEIQPLGYIYLLTWMLERLGYGGWWQQSNARFLKADNDPAEVTCALLGRLKKQVDELNTRMLLVLQYGGIKT